MLGTLLVKIATYKEKSERVKSKIKKALTYPIAVIAVSTIVTAILLIKVVPVFDDMFKGFGANLPAFTQMIVDMSDWMSAYWLYLFGSIGGTIFSFFHVLKRSKPLRDYCDKVMLTLPVIGPIVHKASLARFARTLATMSAAGVPLIQSLDSVAKSAGNIVYTEAVYEIQASVSTGIGLPSPMAVHDIFPSVAIQMTSIGEESGALDSMLTKVADIYEDEVDDAVDNLSTLIEPFIMVFLGIVIGGLIIGMYLPIFKMVM